MRHQPGEFGDLSLVEQQFAVAIRLLGHIARVAVGGYVQRNQPGLAPAKLHITVHKVDFAGADAFYFRAGKHQARLGEL